MTGKKEGGQNERERRYERRKKGRGWGILEQLLTHHTIGKKGGLPIGLLSQEFARSQRS